MYRPSTDWNPMQTQFREATRRPDSFQEAIDLCFSLHAFVHRSSVTNDKRETLADMVFDGLSDIDYTIMPTKRDVTVAWNLWHITRIEDLTMNLLVADGSQVLDAKWQSRLGTEVTDTGNAMTDEKILSFSREVEPNVLWDYRAAVAQKSREIVSSLSPADLKRKFTAEQANRILSEGGLTEHPDSIWLMDFWGKKTVAGILLLPLTRHQAGHLNDCLSIKKKLK
ncbi:DinB family protein [Oscillospiraceae bacterium OttesenSCG-928-G22]|nr:DinB family protein [Oscillospiraceae bacterium OttesenSCG-928-G22]